MILVNYGKSMFATCRLQSSLMASSKAFSGTSGNTRGSKDIFTQQHATGRRDDAQAYRLRSAFCPAGQQLGQGMISTGHGPAITVHPLQIEPVKPCAGRECGAQQPFGGAIGKQNFHLRIQDQHRTRQCSEDRATRRSCHDARPVRFP